MITINDRINTLTPEQTQSLKDKAHAYPFDLYVTIGATGSKAGFQAEVSGLVTRPGVVSIGIDPAHRFTFVRGSKDLGLPDGPELASAGNAHFRSADLVGGIDAIAAKAKALKVTSRVVETQAGTPIVVQERPMASGWWWGLGGLGLVVLGVSVWMWLSKRRRERILEEETAALYSTRVELNNALGDAKIASAEASSSPVKAPRPTADDWDRRYAESARKRSTYSYEPPAPVAPVIVQPQANNDLLTGVLIGDMLSHHRSEPARVERVETTRIVERDDGGSSSSWGSSSSSSSSSWSDSSSSSSWDSSSSSSSYDSGSSGGSDWGGGGGGSDW